jgi:hypothetical protein
MTAAATKNMEAPAGTGLQRISQIPGAKLPIERMRWAPDQHAANLMLLMALGEVTGRLEESYDNYSERGAPGNWLRLCDVDTAALDMVISRVRRKHPEWRFDIGPATTTLDKIDCHINTAQVRARRERAL